MLQSICKPSTKPLFLCCLLSHGKKTRLLTLTRILWCIQSLITDNQTRLSCYHWGAFAVNLIYILLTGRYRAASNVLYQCCIAVNVTCMNVKQVAARRIICAPWMDNYWTTDRLSKTKNNWRNVSNWDLIRQLHTKRGPIMLISNTIVL